MTLKLSTAIQTAMTVSQAHTPQKFSGAGRTGDSRALTLSHSGTAQRNEAGK